MPAWFHLRFWDRGYHWIWNASIWLFLLPDSVGIRSMLPCLTVTWVLRILTPVLMPATAGTLPTEQSSQLQGSFLVVKGQVQCCWYLDHSTAQQRSHCHKSWDRGVGWRCGSAGRNTHCSWRGPSTHEWTWQFITPTVPVSGAQTFSLTSISTRHTHRTHTYM